MALPEQPEYILLEASGVADPSGIALTFMGEDMRDRIRLDSIMCVMDAEQIFAAPEMIEQKLRQAAFADMLILNKVDLVSRDEIVRIKAWLDDRFHRYRLVESRAGDVPLEILHSAGRFDPVQRRSGPSGGPPASLPDVALLNQRAAFLESAAGSRGQTPRQHLPQQKRDSDRGRARPARHPASCRQASGYAVGDEWDDREPRTSIVAIGALNSGDEALLGEASTAAVSLCLRRVGPEPAWRSSAL